MIFKDLLSGIETRGVSGDVGVEVTDVAYDSRQVRPGALFVAVRGYKTDGRNYIPDAVARGAVALVVERAVATDIPYAVVADGRVALAGVAAAFYGHPGRKINVVGVTGTNGKTTVCFLLDGVFRAADYKTALLTTITNVVAGVPARARLTTGEAPEIQWALHTAAAGGAKFAAVEVSSHVLALKRVDGIPFAAAVFTNLSHDHLDFHGDLAHYFAAKATLFARRRPRAPAVLNGDDAYGQVLARTTAGPKVTYGFGAGNDYRARDVVAGWGGVSFTVACPDGTADEVRSPLAGVYNVYNCLAAFAAARELGFAPATIARGIAATARVPGRLETREVNDRLRVVIDYAHSPDSMEKVLQEIRRLAADRVVVVFGCTGERDRAKRPLMGALARRYADYAVITTDDPYCEDPEVIALEVEAGLKAAGGRRGRDYDVILDRRAAIRDALAGAPPAATTVVALLGKGHETIQKVAGREIPYDDHDAVREAVAALALAPPAEARS